MVVVCEASGEGEGGGSRLAGYGTHEPTIGNNPGENDVLYSELWHACAGPNVYVPKVEDKVYYFLQGHIEQVEAYMKQDGKMEMPIYNLPPKILCRVVNVLLQAEPYTDEVFAQLTLIAMTKEEELSSQDENFKSAPPGTNSHFFNKVLTPSDTSTHGGFSVPKRQADECLPPLDMTQNPPAQELVAKDLHGTEWHFRHIFRGQPKRHLLTSGWSTFVTSKKLVAGDACIFLRGDNGELRIGVRRLKKLQNNVSASVISAHSMQHGILANAYHAISNGSIFTVYYRPWTNPSEFLVPYNQYIESATIDYSIGTRIRMKVDGEECPENRLLGTIVGVGDFDGIRWPGSEWRCLEVQWDDLSGKILHPERISPWNIEAIDQTNKKQKRLRQADSSPGFSSLTKDGLLQSTSEHTAKRHLSSWVLQGQEGSKMGLQPYGSRQNPFSGGNTANTGVAFTGSHGVSDDAAASRKLSVSSNSESQECEGSQARQQNGCSKIMIFGVNLLGSTSSPPELPSQQVATSSGLLSPRTVSPTSQSNMSDSIQPSERSNSTRKQCKNCCFVSNRSCTKVLKYGTALGRSVDLARFDGYEGLIRELDDMFDFKGSLIDKSSGWHVTYTDDEGDMMLAGDFPWQEFRSMVQRMFIYPKEEVTRLDLASTEPTSSI